MGNLGILCYDIMLCCHQKLRCYFYVVLNEVSMQSSTEFRDIFINENIKMGGNQEEQTE